MKILKEGKDPSTIKEMKASCSRCGTQVELTSSNIQSRTFLDNDPRFKQSRWMTEYTFKCPHCRNTSKLYSVPEGIRNDLASSAKSLKSSSMASGSSRRRPLRSMAYRGGSIWKGVLWSAGFFILGGGLFMSVFPALNSELSKSGLILLIYIGLIVGGFLFGYHR